MGLLGDLDLVQEMHRDLFRLALWGLANPDRRQRAVFQNGQMREKVKVLKHHSHFGPDLVDVLQVIGQLGSIHHDFARLVLFQPVDAADQR